MDQTMVDRAAAAAFPELKRLIALRSSTDWTLSVLTDVTREIRLVSAARVHVDGSTDEIGVRGESDVRAIRLNPLNEPVLMREGSLVEMLDLMLDLPSPLHPKAPWQVVSGAPSRPWIPSPDGRGRWLWLP